MQYEGFYGPNASFKNKFIYSYNENNFLIRYTTFAKNTSLTLTISLLRKYAILCHIRKKCMDSESENVLKKKISSATRLEIILNFEVLKNNIIRGPRENVFFNML